MKDLKDEIQSKIKDALKTKNRAMLNALKLLKTDITNEEVKKNREELTEEETISIIQRNVKKRKEAIEEFKKVDQPDRAKEEEDELNILMEFLPEQMSEEEIIKVIEKVIADTGAESMKDMGKVMGQAMPLVKGKADGKLVNEIVRQKLS